GNRHQFFEDRPLPPAGKSVKGNDVFPNVRVNVDRDLRTAIRKRRIGCQRNEHLVSDAIDIHDNPRRILLDEFSAEVGYHAKSTSSTTPMTAASIGESV